MISHHFKGCKGFVFLNFINIPSKCRPKTSEVSIHRANSRNQKSAEVLPTIKKIPVNNLTIAGNKLF